MIILGIETSCDETAAAVLLKDKKGIHILSNVVASSASLQAKYGGIIPEQAAREQIKSIIPVIEESLRLASLAQGSSIELDAIAVTYGPGLIGSLLVGVETAKTLATIWQKPLIPVNHLIGHFYANWITDQLSVLGSQLSDEGLSVVSPSETDKQTTGKFKSENRKLKPDNRIPSFPCLGLLVSGGHTDLVLFTGHGKYKYLGGTRDDAAGECFDKCARLLSLPYPGGPEIAKLASQGDALRFKLPIPMKGSKDFDFSYSGLKTAVARIISENSERLRIPDGQNTRNSDLLIHRSPDTPSYSESFRSDLAASIENAIVESLIDKVMLALKTYPVKDVMIAGGVAANQKLAHELKLKIGNWKPVCRQARLEINLHIPSANLCTDNGAMIAAAAFFLSAGRQGQKPTKDILSLQADPNLTLESGT
ncbi:tRNA (adenosine(37)-N6)-threonylcarbamoyltransferase complex transferase subunit TsaD [Candidatus Daviesbacteria bacterium]|nr:tRNA (adenosine(37)-N6)-threonylcarbamoyltransferase complex transferase subunit TsaD [Candidatus Daviesbacteria bacterium]